MSQIHLTPAQLRHAADIKDQIVGLEKQLATILGGSATPAPILSAKPVVAKKRGMSAAGRARVAAAQKLRWAKINKAKAKPIAKPATKKRKMSPEGRARIIAAAKARWAKVRAAKAAKKK